MIRSPFYSILVDGEQLPDELYYKITSVEFKEPEEGEEYLLITFKDHDYSIQDSDMFYADHTIVEVYMGYIGDYGFMMDGIVSGIKPDYPKDGQPTVEIKVSNVANVMDRVERNLKYKGQTYSAVAKTVAKRYNLKTQIEDTTAIYNPNIANDEGIIQAGLSDYALLTKLAEKLNWDYYILKGVLHFHSKTKYETEPVLLEYRIGACNLLSFKPNLSITKKGKKYTMRNINIINKEIVDGSNVVSLADPNTVKKVETPAATPSKTYTVVSGDYLSKIAKKVYGDSTLWKKIYEANTDKIKPPKYVIYPGQVLNIP